MTGSSILDAGRSPAEWVALLAERGIIISERTLREKASRANACHRLGRAMIITPDQMDLILEGGRLAPANPTALPSGSSIEAARAHLAARKHSQR